MAVISSAAGEQKENSEYKIGNLASKTFSRNFFLTHLQSWQNLKNTYGLHFP